MLGIETLSEATDNVGTILVWMYKDGIQHTKIVAIPNKARTPENLKAERLVIH
jgi:translation elongation factor EF-Tu-like GTPase